MRLRRLLVIVGPTCTGKTRLAVAFARARLPAELVNADSRQLRTGLRAGTCAPTAAELAGVRCHLLDLAEPGERFSLHDWLLAARDTLGQLDERGVLPVIVGGTGLYVRALVDGFDLSGVPPDPERRAQREGLAAAGGLSTLFERLAELDPDAARRVGPRNPRRVIRALEVAEATGRPSAPSTRAELRRPALIVGLDVDRATHREWVQRRAERMFRGGTLLEEVRAALARGVSVAELSGCGIGYPEALGVLSGDIDLEAAISRTAQRTLQYARSQRTWWRADARVHWLRPDVLGDAALLERLLRLWDCAPERN